MFLKHEAVDNIFLSRLLLQSSVVGHSKHLLSFLHFLPDITAVKGYILQCCNLVNLSCVGRSKSGDFDEYITVL